MKKMEIYRLTSVICANGGTRGWGIAKLICNPCFGGITICLVIWHVELVLEGQQC